MTGELLGQEERSVGLQSIEGGRAPVQSRGFLKLRDYEAGEKRSGRKRTRG